MAWQQRLKAESSPDSILQWAARLSSDVLSQRRWPRLTHYPQLLSQPQLITTLWLINNNNNPWTIFIVVSSWPQAIARVHSVHLMNAAQAAADPQTKPPDLGCESACRLLSSTTTIAIYYYYSARKLILIYRPTEGRRLSWPRQCRKGAHSSCPRL